MKTVTLPEAVIFGTIIGLWLTGFRFLLAKETRPGHVYILLTLVNCIISILVYAGADALAAWLGGLQMLMEQIIEADVMRWWIQEGQEETAND